MFIPNRNRQELLQKLKTHPLPFEQPFLRREYPDMEEDIRELERAGLVHVISSSSSSVVLHYLRPEAALKVDEDIQALWHSMGDQNKRLRSR